VLLDLVMPGISGPETMRRLLDDHPDLPVVLWSGYSAEDDLPAAAGAEARAFLEKPFELSALVLTIQEVLGRAGG
jgi:CheY-like chemotaxis protein